MTNRGLRGALPAAFTCLAINLAIFVGIAVQRPDYLDDYRESRNPDAVHYVLLGRNFLLDGHYSRCSQPPYVPDLLRTPVYPLFAGGLDILGGPAALYLAQALLQTGACFLLFLLVRPYFGERPAFWASLLLGTDLMLAAANFEAMSEPLFGFLVLASALLLVPALVPPDGREGRTRSLVAGGLVLALAILTRPAGLYLPFLYALLFLGRGLLQRRVLRAAGSALLLLLVALVPAGAWIVRNSMVFAVNRLTNADSVMLVYFAGAGAYQIQHGITLEEAQKRIGEEFGLVPPEVTNNPWVTKKPIAEIDAELRQAVLPVLSKYPRALLTSSVLGIVKATFSHNAGLLATVTGRRWVAPNAGALLRADPKAFERLRQNDPLLVFAFCFQMAHSLLTWVLVPFGVYAALRNPSARWFGLCLLALLLCFYLTVAVVGAEAYSRSRSPHMPFVFALAGLAAGGICKSLVGCGKRSADTPSRAAAVRPRSA